jgi:hypothetical protein
VIKFLFDDSMRRLSGGPALAFPVTGDDGKASATVILGQAPPVAQKVLAEFPSLGKSCEFTVFAGTAPSSPTPTTCS